MRPIDADALIEKFGDWYVEEGTESGFIGTLKNLLSTMPTIQLEKTQLSQESTTSDLISRQAAIDAVDSEVVSTNPEHFKSSEKFIKFMDDADIASFGKWQWANGFNTALVASKVKLEKLPTSQPEPSIPLSWIENEIKWLKSLDNTFSEITALQISAMVNKWRDEQNETD